MKQTCMEMYGGQHVRAYNFENLSQLNFEIVRSCVLSAIHFYTRLFYSVVPEVNFAYIIRLHFSYL